MIYEIIVRCRIMHMLSRKSLEADERVFAGLSRSSAAVAILSRESGGEVQKDTHIIARAEHC